ncbi:hypothetical protein [Hymenobacter rubidus]|uniref:hypothetical protein n=1 Tax=Hymenobacter rubidus TaxID=1441626 RepID=UPI00191DBE53|nr:hypothetical protein [Hymenobacter rubidus]
MLRLFRRRPVARAVAWLTLLALLPVHLSCQSFYRTRGKEISTSSLTALASSKVFILHQGNLTWQLISPRLNGDMLEGVKGELYPTLAQYDNAPLDGKSKRYKMVDSKVVLNLVHVYISDYQLHDSQQVSIPISSIQRIDLVEKDTNKTTASYLLGGTAITVGVLAVIAIIIALTKSSCPFVYASDGQGYHFVGEAYGGAIFAPLERDDYMPLPQLRPQDGEYRLKLTNELKERQYTDVAELWVVDHAPGTQVLLDQRGGVHTLGQLQAPTRARTASGADCAAQLQAADHNVFLFNEELPAATANGVTLAFAKPAQAASPARLVLRAQNSLWLDYLYGEFAKKFGASYAQWAEHEKQVPAAKLNQWLQAQSMPLSVYVETARGWQLVEHIPLVGSLAARDLVVPIDLSQVAGSEVRIKVETGFMFWELDYAALDTSPEQLTSLEKYAPLSALDEKSTDQRAALAAADGQPLRQLHQGTEVSLVYPAKPAITGTQRTAFFHARGYYEHIREYQGVPNLPELYSFRKPGRLVEFSKEKYRETTHELQLTAMRP